jgi:hypothetical protein
MIKIFRKTRQKLLMENKTGKYLKYALGEIILVVIGILIALNINSWNERRIEKSMTIDFLKNIRLDLQTDIKKLSENSKAIPEIIDSAQFLLNNTELESLTANELFDKLPYSSHGYKINTQSYKNLLNSGITKYFEFDALINEINIFYTSDLKYYSKYIDWDFNATETDGKSWLNMNFEVEFNSVDKIRFEQSEASRKAVFLKQIKSPYIRNFIRLNILRKQRIAILLQEVLKKAKEIVSKIDKQLKE